MIIGRQWVLFAYLAVTAITCIQAIFKSSFAVGGTALVSSVLCYFSVATFVGSFLARHDKNYSIKDLGIIGAIALALSLTGLALMVWSGFWIGLFGIRIEGPIWAIFGMLVAVLTTKREHAL